MSLSVTGIQNVSLMKSTPTFKGGANPKLATKIVSENKPKADNALKTVMEIAGWVLAIGLLIGGWVSACGSSKTSQKPTSELSAPVSENNAVNAVN